VARVPALIGLALLASVALWLWQFAPMLKAALGAFLP
jgi:hypothetical protein